MEAVDSDVESVWIDVMIIRGVEDAGGNNPLPPIMWPLDSTGHK